MFDSKALKEFPKTKSSKLYLWWIQTPVADWYYDIVHRFIDRPIGRIKKMYGWYVNVFHNDFDFDGHSLFAIIEYKLIRVDRALLEGHAYQEPQDLKAIKLAIKIAGRLKEDGYSERGHDRVDKRFGKSKYWFEPCNDGTTHSYWHSSRPLANTDEEKAQLRNFTMDQYRLSDIRMKRDEKLLYAILNKYLRKWWD